MCGIAGIVNFDPRVRVDQSCLRRMCDVLTHRGPDGEGLFVDGPVGLAHRRLAIIDLNGGDQPMGNEDGTIWVVFNGEIYNHAALRPALEAHGHRYKTRCDTESILHLYEEKGDRVVEHLHGMFAFAVWDRERRHILLARDRLGIKPLYYASTDTQFLFASEIKALLAVGSIRPTFNEETLPEFLSTRFVSGDETFFRGVRKLLPGHVLALSLAWPEPGRGACPERRQRADAVRTRRYWHLPPPAGEAPKNMCPQARDLRVRLEAAVTSHLMSDVPLGVFLSGGLDSSALAAMVARATPEPIRTFAVGFADRDANELPYARLVAGHVGAEHRDLTVTPSEFFEALPRLIWHEDEPIAFPSSVPLYFVARLARDHVKVVLTGEGADELFLGYNRYRVTLWNQRLGRPYWAVVPRPLRDEMRRFVGALPSPLSRVAARTFLALEPGIRNLFLENFAVVPERLQRHILQRPDVLDVRDPHAPGLRCYEDAAGGMLDRMSRTDLQTYLLELLMKQDQMSMAASIESRVPFLDDHLVEHVAAMPGGLKLRGWQTKAVLRDAVRDLVPPSILTRRKMGFPVPVGRWLGGEFWPLVEEFVLGPRTSARRLFNRPAIQQLAAEHRAGDLAHGDRLWLLVNLEIWQRIFCDGEDPADLTRTVRQRRPRTTYANPLGEDGRSLAANQWRPRPQPPDHLGALAATPSHAGHDARAGR